MEPGSAGWRRRRPTVNRSAVTDRATISIEEKLMKFWPSGSRAWISVFLFFLTLICSVALAAQTQAGRLRGQIVDATGAVIPGANITVKNSSGLAITATSDAAGAYDA